MSSSVLMRNVIHTGDALHILPTLPENSVDAIICDPPAGISFMGKSFDSDRGGRTQWVAWLAEIMQEALRMLKPGGHALVWALPRTSHWTACALEDAGFEIRDKFYHLFASGFPKSLDVSKAIDRIAGAEREYVGPKTYPGGTIGHDSNNHHEGWQRPWRDDPEAVKRLTGITIPATPEAKKWEGWGTALKPAVEEWILARKPLSEPSVAANMLKWGVGGINVDATRVPHTTVAGGNLAQNTHLRVTVHASQTSAFNGRGNIYRPNQQGRWPSHLLISHAENCQPGACVPGCPALELDEQSDTQYGDEGGASRYFTQFSYAPKASKTERNLGCEGLPEQRVARMGHGNDEQDERTQSFISQPQANIHPTVKNQQLMRWLCRLITPPGGIVLDCFAGSGSTGVAAIAEDFQFIGIELDHEYASIARTRLDYALAEAEKEAQQEKQLPLFNHEQPLSAPKTKAPKCLETPLSLWLESEVGA
jgi:site-specific DNA-methyltransferase (adenine-specific)